MSTPAPAELDALTDEERAEAMREFWNWKGTPTAVHGFLAGYLAGKRSAQAQLAAAEQRIATVRAVVIDECAQVCDGVRTEIGWRKIDAQYGEACEECARAIRQLASKSERTDRGSS